MKEGIHQDCMNCAVSNHRERVRDERGVLIGCPGHPVMGAGCSDWRGEDEPLWSEHDELLWKMDNKNLGS